MIQEMIFCMFSSIIMSDVFVFRILIRREYPPQGSGLMILASKLSISAHRVLMQSFSNKASQRNIRIYIEYPQMIPGIEEGENSYIKLGYYGAVKERTVVSSGFFGPAVPELTILEIKDCHYVKFKAEEPALVLACVEGYNKAVYGLPEESNPLLFFSPDKKILVSSTKLSNFVSGRFMPNDAWPHIIEVIVEWTAGRDISTPVWTPSVKPMYDSSERTAKDAVETAVRRGVAYYRKSGLYLRSDWPSQKAPGNDSLPLVWERGDGSDGIGECYISKMIYSNGRQAVSREARADCNLEAAMGLSCGKALFRGNSNDAVISNLCNFVFRNSPLATQERSDPSGSSYGLLGWSISNPSSYWGDDNARALLSVIAVSGLTGNNSWNENIVRGVLANFRTTGINGFRPANISGKDLEEKGWKSFFNSDMVFFNPHMEAYLWATYLWLYSQTGFHPLLERSKTGIEKMMAAYPNWHLEANRFEQERCRMLLPLAWLVRVEDTPQHRAWLDEIAGYVISIQDKSGAIPQIPGTIVSSNAGYGTGECALCHEAGDPVTDALYSINFAFIGMHEAAVATGKEEYKQSAARMADFFVRTQTRSEKHEELDGTWYRGFDYSKWDYWGSDGDWGWGVWTNEIGWTHSWITATLTLNAMRTSLWDVASRVDVDTWFDLCRKKMLPDETFVKKVSVRTEIDLSGSWKFIADTSGTGENNSWFNENADRIDWKEVMVPVGFDNCGTGMERYFGTGWFFRKVIVPESWRGKRIVLHFEGINYNARVWINGIYAGENHDAFLPFNIPADSLLRLGYENMIAVSVNNIRHKGQFPLFEGWYGQGGFLREASILATDETYIGNTVITAEPLTGVKQGKGHLLVSASVTTSSNEEKHLRLGITVSDKNGNQLSSFFSPLTRASFNETELKAEAVVNGIKAWSPNTPALYDVELTLWEDEKKCDQLSKRTGFRKIEIKDAGLFINGEKTFLLGFNRHEDSPRTGMAADLGQAREDFIRMKKAGCNYVRFCHYPHHPGELDLCDELGLYVLAENAMNEWGHIDHPAPNPGFRLEAADAPLIIHNAERTLIKMVNRDNHHPSIIIWSVSNENEESLKEVAEGNQYLVNFGKKLDNSRPWTHVSNCFRKPGWENFYISDDVIVVNVYPTHWYKASEEDYSSGLLQSTKIMQDTLKRLHDRFPSKPIIIGEYGYPGGEDGKKQADFQAMATEAEFKGLGAPYLAGGALWCFARHPWPWYNMSTYGYVSRDRKTEFPAFAVIRKLYREKAEATK